MTDGLTAPAIEVDNLSIHYGNVSAVSSVSFCISHGEQLTLLGLSGCGKTSTLRAVAGLEQPSGGGWPTFAASGTGFGLTVTVAVLSQKTPLPSS